MVMKFLKSTVLDDDEKSSFVFKVIGNAAIADKFIHRMRVDLSRMRDLARQMGKVTRHFKMIVESLVYDEETGHTTVTLKRTTSALNVDNEVSELFDELTVGDVISG